MEKDTVYKTTSIDWIGEYPIHWNIKRLKYLVTLINEDVSENSKLVKISLENIESFSGKLINLDSKTEFMGEGKIFERGDVLFNKLRPYLAKVYKAIDRGICLGELLVLRPSCEITSDFLYYRVISEPFISEVNSSTYGAKMPRANWDFIRNLTIPYPTIMEQNIVVRYLDLKVQKIDFLISKKQKLIDLLEEERLVVINQAVTKGINPDIEMKYSGIEWLRDIPKNWVVKKLSLISSITRLAGYEYTLHWKPSENGEIIALRGYNIGQDKLILNNYERITDALSQKLIRSRLFQNDIVFPCVGSIGNAVLISENDKYHINQNIAKITPNDTVVPKFLLYFLLSHNCKFQIKFYNTSDAQPSVLVGNLRKFLCPIPPVTEQLEIANYLDKYMKNIDLAKNKIIKEIDFLREYRTALISEVVTGKIDVRDEVVSWI